MTLRVDLEWHAYRYFPYEQHLARREVCALLGTEPEPTDSGLSLAVNEVIAHAVDQLTYFREARINGVRLLTPLQARLEASASRSPGDGPQGTLWPESPRLGRQSTRYSAHGLHEYRGKFNPQIVRAVGNVLGMAKGAWVLDPFCGSGTSLLECAHSGWNGLGVDLNPLGVFITNAKLAALSVPLGALREQADALTARLLTRSRGMNFQNAFVPAERKKLRPIGLVQLPNREYLERWFSLSVLAQLECVTSEISLLESEQVRLITRTVLSDCLRSVSWQDPADLRIRRRKSPQENYPAIPSFVAQLHQRIQRIAQAREVLGEIEGSHHAIQADSRCLSADRLAPLLGPRVQFDAVITSPPYATALPYIDTQRLSLAFLGLVTEEDIRRAERELIGNREISPKERAVEESCLQGSDESLPDDVLTLCRRARKLAARAGNGFRRRNVPALLFRYFRDMRAVFSSVGPLLRSSGTFALVVGPNRTTLGGENVIIDTPRLLASVAEHAGWRLAEIVPLDAYQRFDLHRKNSITQEALVILRRPEVRGRSRSGAPGG